MLRTMGEAQAATGASWAVELPSHWADATVANVRHLAWSLTGERPEVVAVGGSRYLCLSDAGPARAGRVGDLVGLLKMAEAGQL